MYLRTCGSFKSANRKKDCVRKSQIHKASHLRKVRKSNKLFKSANLRICDFRNLYADRPAFPIQRTKSSFPPGILLGESGSRLRFFMKKKCITIFFSNALYSS